MPANGGYPVDTDAVASWHADWSSLLGPDPVDTYAVASWHASEDPMLEDLATSIAASWIVTCPPLGRPAAAPVTT